MSDIEDMNEDLLAPRGDLQSCARVGADAWLRHGAALRAGRLAA